MRVLCGIAVWGVGGMNNHFAMAGAALSEPGTFLHEQMNPCHVVESSDPTIVAPSDGQMQLLVVIDVQLVRGVQEVHLSWELIR